MGLRSFKAQLSKHVRLAERGTTITITDRGRAIAVLGPVKPTGPPAWTETLVAAGAAWSGGKPFGLASRVKQRGRAASEQVIEDRR